MKRTFLASILIFVLALNTYSQTQDRQVVLSVNGGMSLVESLIRGVYNTSGNVKSQTYPAFQINADYGLGSNFSIGGAFSYQAMGSEIRNLGYYTFSGAYKVAPLVDLEINRLNFAARFLYHYNTNNEDFDAYSGLRVGYTVWEIKHNIVDARNFELNPFNAAFAPQLVLIGFRGYFIDNFGVNIELAIGSPHYMSMGFVLKL